MNKELIFIIDSPFPYCSGGRETWLYNIFEKLIRERYTINLINKNKSGVNKHLFFLLDKRIRTISIPTLPRFLKAKWPFANLLLLFNAYLFSILTYLVIITKFKNYGGKPLIITMNPGFNSLPALFLREKNFKYLCCVRGKYAYESSYKAFCCKKFWFNYFRKLEIKTMNSAEMILANGWDTKDNISKYLDQKTKKKVEVLPNGVNFSQYNKAKIVSRLNIKKDIIMSVATLRDIKGISAIIKAIPYVIKENKNVKFVFVGKGNQKPYVEQARNLHILDYIMFLGERSDVPSLLKQSRTALCVSEGSGISHSALEALASGTCVVAWNSQTYRQIIRNNVNGLLAKENDILDLASKILLCLKNAKLSTKIGNAGSESVRKYDWENITKQFLEEMSCFNE